MRRSLVLLAFLTVSAFVTLRGVAVDQDAATPLYAQSTAELEAAAALLQESGRVFHHVARRVEPAVVYLEAHRRSAGGNLESDETGSGVIVRPDGVERPVIVTNLHVLAGALEPDIDIHLTDGRLLHPAELRADEQTDIAVLLPRSRDLPAVHFGDSDAVHVGQWVLALGSPFGLSQSVSHGIISAKHRRQVGVPGDLRMKEFLQTDAAINPGNSGGPLVDLQGRVIGINAAIASHSGSNSGVGFSIPSNLVHWVVRELTLHGHVRRGYLGVEFPREYRYDDARSLGLPVVQGALIAYVHGGTPAAQAGIRPRDVILSFDGEPIDDENHLINVVSQTPAGQSVEVIVWRGGHRETLRAVIGSWDEHR